MEGWPLVGVWIAVLCNSWKGLILKINKYDLWVAATMGDKSPKSKNKDSKQKKGKVEASDKANY